MNKNLTLRLIPALLAVAFSGGASASGFQLLEQNASGLGAAYAGSAAIAEDASTIFWNPAGMAYLPKGKMQVVGAVNFVKPSAKFSNGGSVMPAGITTTGGDGGDAGGWAVVPSAYFAMPLNDQVSIGLAINAPFGLKTEYDSNWVGRFRAIESDVKTMNINPSISFKANEMWSLGFGVTASKLDGTFSNAVNASGALLSSPLCAPASPLSSACGRGAVNNLEGTGTIEGDDWGWGYNLGVIFQPSAQTRLGASYRSSIKYSLGGDVNFSRPTVTTLGAQGNALANGALAAGLYNGGISADIELPDTLILSAWHQLNDNWEIMADVSRTGWAKIQELKFVRTDGSASGSTLSNTQENWRNTWRVALGGAYKYSNEWKFRAGVAFDQSPVDDDNYRTPRLPDNDRTWLTLGAQYKPSKDLWFDAGYAYIFVKDSQINDNGGSAASQAASGLLKGSYNNDVNIFALQATYSF